MGAFSTILTALSVDVVAALATANYPPLTPDASGNAGKILVGPAKIFENSSPPRIIFEPLGSKFVAAEYYSASATLETTERQRQAAMRTIAGENVMFNCRCWGAAGTSDAVDDYDVTRGLYHQVRASLQKLFPGAHETEETGKYTTGTNVAVDGREFVFGVTFYTPILAALLPFDVVNYSAAQIATVVAGIRAPSNVTYQGTDRLVIQTGEGSAEPGCD